MSEVKFISEYNTGENLYNVEKLISVLLSLF